MGLKNLHPYARYKLKVYHKETSLSSVLKRYETDIIFIDFCCIFFLLLQNGPGTDIIRQSLKDNREYDHFDLARAINQFISRVLQSIKRMRSGKNDLDVCLVIDGPSIPAKKKTCEERKSRQSNSLKNNFSWKIKKAIQQNLESRADVIPYREYLKPTAITTVTMNKKQQKRQDDSNDKKKGITYFHFAAYEADAEIVYLCNQLTKNKHGAIMSNDGDLFAYPGAFNALRIIQIDWNSSSIPVTITTKGELLRKLGFPTSKKLRLLGETKMAVLASLCGNDYAPIPIATFNDIVQVIGQINCPVNSNDISADKLLQLVYEELIRNKDINISNNFDPQRFSIALHQFCIPLISGVTFDKFRCCHYPGLHINIDKNIITQLGKERNLISHSNINNDNKENALLHQDNSTTTATSIQHLHNQNPYYTLSPDKLNGCSNYSPNSNNCTTVINNEKQQLKQKQKCQHQIALATRAPQQISLNEAIVSSFTTSCFSASNHIVALFLGIIICYIPLLIPFY